MSTLNIVLVTLPKIYTSMIYNIIFYDKTLILYKSDYGEEEKIIIELEDIIKDVCMTKNAIIILLFNGNVKVVGTIEQIEYTVENNIAENMQKITCSQDSIAMLSNNNIIHMFTNKKENDRENSNILYSVTEDTFEFDEFHSLETSFFGIDKKNKKIYSWGKWEEHIFCNLIFTSESTSEFTKESQVISFTDEIKDIKKNKYTVVILFKRVSLITWGINLFDLKDTINKEEQINQRKNKFKKVLNENKIDKIYNNSNAFAAITKDRKVITWGDVHTQQFDLKLTNIDEIYFDNSSFIVLTPHKNEVLIWGVNNTFETSIQQLNKSKLSKIIPFPNGYAILNGNKLFTKFGIFDIEDNEIEEIKEINQIRNFLLVLLKNGNLIIFRKIYDSMFPRVGVINNVKELFCNETRFIALLNDNSCIGRGDSILSGNPIKDPELKNVHCIYPHLYSFVIIQKDYSDIDNILFYKNPLRE